MSTAWRLALALALLLAGAGSRAHDLITADAVERYLARADVCLAAGRDDGRPARRAAALYDLARMLDEIRDLLNRDIAMHGRVQGLPSNLLVSELRARGVEFGPDARTGRFASPSGYFRASLALDPRLHGGDAGYRLMRGRFYDSFDADPLRTRLDREAVAEQLRLGEALLARRPEHPEREEIAFMVTVHLLHAMQLGSADEKARYWQAARTQAGAFAARYPESMRRAAIDALIEMAQPGR